MGCQHRRKKADAGPRPYRMTRYLLRSGGRANSSDGDGRLSAEPPAEEPPDRYVYDPLDPVPTRGGRSMIDVLPGVENQAEVERREDVLVYTTPQLTEALAIAGPVSVTLFASSSAPDTDFTAKLVDVEPDGYCANIAEGIVRARYREGCDREEFLEPGEIVEFTIDLWDMAHTFLVGHRLRLEISSSNFPRFDRNLNSRVTPALGRAEDARKAEQRVFHDAAHASCLRLPLASA